jgi:hypothetical protein
MNFHCGLYSTNDTILCLNPEATCANQGTDQEVCVCPKGYVHDFTGPHSDNCSMPESYLLILLCVNTVGYGISILAVLLKFAKLRVGVRRLAVYFAASLIFQWAWILSLYLQDGSYEGVPFFSWLWGEGLILCCREIAVQVTAPVFAILCKPIDSWKRVLDTFSICISILFLGISITGMIYARSEPRIYNPIYTAYLFFLFFLVCGLAALVVLKLRELKRLLIETESNAPSSSLQENSRSYKGVVERINFMIIVVLGFGNICAPGYLIAALCMITLASFPMNFVFVTLISLSLWPSTPLVIIYFDGKQRDTTPRQLAIVVPPSYRFMSPWRSVKST